MPITVLLLPPAVVLLLVLVPLLRLLSSLLAVKLLLLLVVVVVVVVLVVVLVVVVEPPFWCLSDCRSDEEDSRSEAVASSKPSFCWHPLLPLEIDPCGVPLPVVRSSSASNSSIGVSAVEPGCGPACRDYKLDV